MQQTFIRYRKEMKGLDWGSLYNSFQEASRAMNPNEIEEEVARLMADSDVENKPGL